MRSPARDFAAAAGVVLAALGAVYYLGLLRLAWIDALRFNDFGTFWRAVQAWEAGGSLYATDAAFHYAGVRFRNLTLPHGHLLFLPVAGLPLPTAATVWLALGSLSIVASLWIIVRERGRALSAGEGLWLLWSAPVQAQLVTGQVGAILLLPATLLWRAIRREHWAHVGVWSGMIVGLKPFAAPVLLWLVWRRRWTAVTCAALVIAAQGAVGLLIFGAASYAEWHTTVQHIAWTQSVMNASWMGLVTRATVPSPLVAAPVAAPLAGMMLCMLGIGLVVLLTIYACRRYERQDDQWTVVLLGTLLVSPVAWAYYLLWLLPVWLTKGMPRLTAACWLAPVIMAAPATGSPLVTMTLGSAYAYGLLVWWTRVALPPKPVIP